MTISTRTGFLMTAFVSTLMMSACSPNQTQDQETASWKTYHQEQYNVSVKYPADWTAGSGSFVSPEGPIVIQLYFNPLRLKDTWQEDSQWYGNTKATALKINGRDVISTTYPEEGEPSGWYREDLSTPVFDGKAYVKLSIDNCPSAQKKTCTDVLYAMEKSLVLPTTPSTTWQTYTDQEHGFSFDYPPQTEVSTFMNHDMAGVPNGRSGVSIVSGTQGASWGYFNFYTKPANTSLLDWYNGLSDDAIGAGPGQRTIFEQGTYYGYTGLKTQKYDAYILYLTKGTTVIALTFDTEKFEVSDADQKRFMDSIRLL